MVKSYFGLILFTKAKSCQTFIYYFTLKIPAGTNLISYLSVTLLLLLATPHRKSSRATFLVILSGYISITEKDFPTKFCTLAYHKKCYPKTQIWGFIQIFCFRWVFEISMFNCILKIKLARRDDCRLQVVEDTKFEVVKIKQYPTVSITS